MLFRSSGSCYTASVSPGSDGSVLPAPDHFLPRPLAIRADIFNARSRAGAESRVGVCAPGNSAADAGKVQVSVARYLRTPPYAAKRKGLVFDTSNCLRSQSHRSTVVICNCTCGPITVVPTEQKLASLDVRRSYFDPILPQRWRDWWSRRVPPPGPSRVLQVRLSP